MRSTVSIAAIIFVLAAAPARGEDPKMLKAVEHHHAGIVLAVPAGFTYDRIGAPFDVMRAGLVEQVEQKKRVVTVSLAAYPVGPKATAKSFADGLNAEIRKSRTVLNFKSVKRTQMKVAGIDGAAEMLRFLFRKEEMAAARVVFIREIKDPKLRICYVLTAEAPLKHKDRVLGVFGAMVKSVLLVPLRHPCALGVKELSRPIRIAKRRFEVRPPVGWYVATTTTGIETGRMDYLLGEIAPRVRVTAKDLHQDESAKDCARKDIAAAGKGDKTNGFSTEVLWQGPAELGGRAGYAFVLRRTARGKDADLAVPVIIARRIVCVPAAAGRPPRRYTLSLTARCRDFKKAEEIFEKIASGFRFVEPTTAPATAPSTAPATAPATVPATAPATTPASATAPNGGPNSERHGLPFGAVALTGCQGLSQAGIQR